MAQQPHVPKFGNWDNDNTPYTIYFENAQKEKTTGGSGARMNPNDPEENPEAFGMGRGRIMNPNDPEDMVAPPSPLHVHSRKPPLDQKRHDRSMHRNNNSDEPKSITSESGSERSNPEHGRVKSDKKSLVGSSSSSSLSSSHGRKKSGISDNSSHGHRATSVPKFGTWDENDPTSGDGFTVIFNRVKEEKHIGSANFPVPPQQNTHSNTHQKHGSSSSSLSKICCCFF